MEEGGRGGGEVTEGGREGKFSPRFATFDEVRLREALSGHWAGIECHPIKNVRMSRGAKNSLGG